MKYKYLLILLLFKINSFSQQKDIKIEYKVRVFEEENLFTNNPSLKKMLDNAIRNSYHLSFTLLVNNNKSKFFINPILISDIVGLSEGQIFPFIGYRGKVYTYNDTIFSQVQLLGNDFYRLDTLKDNWKITTESKKIDGYLCYKATNIYQVKNTKNTFNHPVIAWFCPDLPFSFGPNGYGNLPGLILELQVRNYVYGVNKINLNSIEKFNIDDDLKNIKKLSESELEKMLLKKLED